MGAMMTGDEQLLARWVRQRDAEAFRALTLRHGSMVFGTCLRVLANATDAEDATQNVSVELARSAARVKSSVGRWLHGMATRQAFLLRGREQRRARRVRGIAVRARGVLVTVIVAGVIGGAAMVVQGAGPTPGAVGAAGTAATVVRGVQQAYVAGMEHAEWGNATERQDSTLGSAYAALEAIGVKVTYTELMGLGGAAFRLQVGHSTLGPDAPNALVGRDVIGPALAAVGWQVRWMPGRITPTHVPATEEEQGAARDAIVASIDAGVPVLASSEECAVIAGYRERGAVLLMRPYSPQKPGYVEKTELPWLVGILTKATVVPERAAAVRTSLRAAVEMARTPTYNNMDSGLAAYASWAQRLRGGMPQDQTLGNGYTYGCLWNARKAAAEYLEGAAPALGEAAQAHLLKAAAIYRDMTKRMTEPRANLRHPWMYMPWDLKGSWTPAMQAAQATMLEEIAGLERQAVAELELAVKAEADAEAASMPAAFELAAPEPPTKTWIEGFAASGGLRPLLQVIDANDGTVRSDRWFDAELFPLLMGVTGDAFRFVWYRDDGAAVSERDRWAVASPEEQYLPALAAWGYAGRVEFAERLTGKPPGLTWDEPTLRREIVAALAGRGRPVLLVDVPEPGWNAVIVGYVDGGKTLVGWCEPGWESFGFRFDPAKKRRFERWFGQVGGVVMPGARQARTPEAKVLRAALERGAALLRQRAVGNVVAGPATYEELARRLGDESLSATDAATAKRRDALLFPMYWDLATQRMYAAGFARHASAVFPEAADELTAAADALDATSKSVWEIHRIGGGTDPGSPLPKLADAALRQQVIDIVLAGRDRDLEAAEQIEAARKKIDEAAARH